MASDSSDSEYFSEDGAKQREAIRERIGASDVAQRERESIAKSLRLDDPALVERIHCMGFNGDSARVIDLLPLIHVSWADGSVTRNERALILSILEERKIERDSDAWMLVEALLEKRPSETFLAHSLDVLNALLGDERGRVVTLVDLCAQVAAASGGLLGFGDRTSGQERELMAKVAEALGKDAEVRFRQLLERPRGQSLG